MAGFIQRRIGRQISLAVGVGLFLIVVSGLILLYVLAGAAPDIHKSCWREFKELANLGLAAAAGILVAAVVLNLLLVRRYLAQPISKLMTVMKSAEKGNFLVRADLPGSNEISELGQSFNKMLVTITDLYADRLEKERELIIAQQDLKYKNEIERRKREVEEANEALEKRLRELSLLYDVTKTVNSTLELDDILKSITELVGSTMGYKQFVMFLMSEDGGELHARAVYGFEDAGCSQDLVFKKGEGITWVVAETGRYVLVPDTAAEPRYLYFKGRQKSDGACLSVPMMHQGRCVGVMNFLRPHGYTFMKEEIDFLSSVADQVAVATVNARLHQKTVELSITDALTGVFNRRYFNRKSDLEFDEARRYRSPVSVLMIDIDRFKLFNDLNGHGSGDEALRRVASVLTANTRRVDIVSRYGGEEFCIMLPNTTKNRGFEAAEKLRKAVEAELVDGGENFPGRILTISVGVASFPGDGHDVSGVLDAADKALYHAKNTGRNRVVMHEPGMAMPMGSREA